MEFKTCPKCNSDILDENRFCGKCGYDFGEIIDIVEEITSIPNNGENHAGAPVLKSSTFLNKKMYYKIAAIAGVLIIAFIAIYIYYIIPYQKYIEDLNGYNKAVADINSRQLDDALNNLKLIGNFKDSQELIKEAIYQKAMLDIYSHQYDDALLILNQISGYKDSQALIKTITMYQNALTDIKADKINEALNNLSQAKSLPEAVSLMDVLLAYNNDLSKQDYDAVLDDLNNKQVDIPGLFSTQLMKYENNNFIVNYATGLINSGQYDKALGYLMVYGTSSPDYSGLYYYDDYLDSQKSGESSAITLEENVSPDYSGPYSGTIKSIVLNYLYNRDAESFPGLVQTQDDEMSSWADAYQQAQAPAKPDPAIGMTADEVRNSNWGSPEEINTTTTATDVEEQWVYGGNRYIYLDNGVVTAIQDQN